MGNKAQLLQNVRAKKNENHNFRRELIICNNGVICEGMHRSLMFDVKRTNFF